MSEFIGKSEIVNSLRGLNPWWHGGKFPVPSTKRTAFYPCVKSLGDALSGSGRRGILICGPRRTGKSTLLWQLIDELQERFGRDPGGILYISFDHPILKFTTLQQILGTYHETVWPVGEPFVLLLDEVQYLKSWESELKLLLDLRQECIIVATGSASQPNKTTESGVGRWKKVQLPTLSFYEFLELKSNIQSSKAVSISDSFIRKPSELVNLSKFDLDSYSHHFMQLMPFFNEYLFSGGFPETLKKSQAHPLNPSLREDIIDGVIKKDLVTFYGIRNLDDIEKLFIYLCRHSGEIIGVKTAADDVGTTTVTVTSHLAILEHANLIYRLSPSNVEGKEKQRTRYKFFMADSGLRNAILSKGSEILSIPEEVQQLVSMTLFRHLFTYPYWPETEVLYWKDSISGKEVDVLISGPNFQIAMQIDCSDSFPDKKKINDLDTYCSLSKVSAAFIVTKSIMETVLLPTSNVLALKIPAHIFAYLLGKTALETWTKQLDKNTL